MFSAFDVPSQIENVKRPGVGAGRQAQHQQDRADHSDQGGDKGIEAV